MTLSVHRVAFLAPIGIAERSEATGVAVTWIELVLFNALFGVLVRHPRLAVTDPYDTTTGRMNDQIWLLDHEHLPEIKAEQFARARRSELLFFDFALDANEATLYAEQRDGQIDAFAGSGGCLSDAIESALARWLDARGLGPCPVPVPVFTVHELLTACGSLAAHAAMLWSREPPAPDAPEGALPAEEPPWPATPAVITIDDIAAPLVPAFLHALTRACRVETTEIILEHDPEDVVALRNRFFMTLGSGRDYALLRRIIELAPGWGKPYLSWFQHRDDDGDDEYDDGPDEDGELHAFAKAAVRLPANHHATWGYADRLTSAARTPEQIRWMSRTLAAAPEEAEFHLALMERECGTNRMGAWFLSARARTIHVDELAGRTRVDQIEHFQLHLEEATAYLNIGRLSEAIAQRGNLLAGLEDTWPRHTEILRYWQTDPALLGQLYAREGYYRGDPGRIEEGFSVAAPSDSLDLQIFIDGLIALGEPEQALLAYAQFGAEGRNRHPITMLSAAQAMVLTDRLDLAIDEILCARLRYPQAQCETAEVRVLRMAACCPIDRWEAAIRAYADRGALALARACARDAADFVPGAAASAVIVDALARARPPIAFAGEWLAALRALVRSDDARAIDAVFARAAAADLAAADELVQAWPSAGMPPNGGAAPIVYALAQALVRYFALATAAPTPLGGALRTVAVEALEACRLARDAISGAVLRALWVALDAASEELDPALLDVWLLRIERALDIDARCNSDVTALVHELPRIAALLRGDEQIADELATAYDLLQQRPAGWAATAARLLERGVRAGGGDIAGEWSEAIAEAAGDTDDALDAHQLAAFVTTDNAAPCIHAARILFARGRGAQAVDALATGLDFAGADWKAERIAELAPLWRSARLDVPITFSKAAKKAFDALQSGDAALAIRCQRWCLALDNNDDDDDDRPTPHVNLGIGYAQLGDVFAAVRAFSGANTADGPKLAAAQLQQAGHRKAALAVYRYAARWFVDASDHRAHGAAAWHSADHEAMAAAYGRAFAIDPRALQGADLNGYADALFALGRYDEVEAIAKRLQRVGKGDAALEAVALYHLAAADLGRGRFEQAAQLAAKAVKKNPRREDAADYESLLARARRSEAPVPRRTDEESLPPAARARRRLADSDFAAAQRLADAHPADRAALHAGLVASRFRYGSENGARVVPRARAFAERVLALSRGSLDLTAACARALALRIREDDLFPLDPPPPLGDRMTRDELRRAFAQRSGAPEPPPAIPVDEPDLEPFPGAAVARASDYCALLRALSAGPPLAALAARGLTLEAFESICAAWRSALAADPALARSVTQRALRGRATLDACAAATR